MEKYIGFLADFDFREPLSVWSNKFKIQEQLGHFWVKENSEAFFELFSIHNTHNIWQLDYSPQKFEDVPTYLYSIEWRYTQQEKEQASFSQVNVFLKSRVCMKEADDIYMRGRFPFYSNDPQSRRSYPHQIGYLVLDFPKTKTSYPAVFETRSHQLICHDDFRKALESISCTGIEFLPVFSDLQRKKQIDDYWQIKIVHILPPMLKLSYHQDNPALYDGTPPLISEKLFVYAEENIKDFKDFNLTAELWGMPFWPLPVFSKRVSDILKKFKVKVYDSSCPITFA